MIEWRADTDPLVEPSDAQIVKPAAGKTKVKQVLWQIDL